MMSVFLLYIAADQLTCGTEKNKKKLVFFCLILFFSLLHLQKNNYDVTFAITIHDLFITY